MNIFVTIYSAILFFLLTPGILVTLPPASFKYSSKYVVAATHGLVFAIVYMFTYKFVKKITKRLEGYEGQEEEEGQEKGEGEMGTKKKKKME